jgi:hypothetical protein
MKYPIVEITDDQRIYFEPGSERFGHAEFLFCPVWRRGTVRELFITRLQQERHGEMFHVAHPDPKGASEFQVSSWRHEGMEPPNVWLMLWCAEHKTMALEVYVPVDAHSLRVESMSCMRAIFEKTRADGTR